MWKLIGQWPSYDYPHTEEHIVATFDTEEAAKEYIENSKSKLSPHYTFKQNSLLNNYYDAYVTNDNNLLGIPHNPEME